MKIAFLDAHNNDYAELTDVIRNNRILYCKRHGYTFVEYVFDKLEPLERTPHWGRILGLKKHLPDFDWIFYQDSDAVIMNKSIPLNRFIDDDYNCIVGPLVTESHISTSSIIIKNCEWSFKFLDHWYSHTQFIDTAYFGDPDSNFHAVGNPNEGGKFYEQSAFHYIYDHDAEYRNKIKTVTCRQFNSVDCPGAFIYEPGDFMLHFPGRTKAEKIAKMKHYLHQQFKLI